LIGLAIRCPTNEIGMLFQDGQVTSRAS